MKRHKKYILLLFNALSNISLVNIVNLFFWIKTMQDPYPVPRETFYEDIKELVVIILVRISIEPKLSLFTNTLIRFLYFSNNNIFY